MSAIHELGLRYGAARRAAEAVRKLRDPIDCTKEYTAQEILDTFPGNLQAPCWKKHRVPPEGEYELIVAPSHWCSNCTRREELTQQYVPLRRKEIGLRGALTRACFAELDALTARAEGSVKP